MTVYAGQVLRIVKTSGEVSATYLTVTDDDSEGSGKEPGTLWNVCGNFLPKPPALISVLISGTLLDGSAFLISALQFTFNGRDFFLLPSDRAPEAIATVTDVAVPGIPANFPYLERGLSVDDEALQSGLALTVTFDSRGGVMSKAVGRVVVSDDDALIQFGAGETGRGAEVLFSPQLGARPFNQTGPDHMVLVDVSYHAATGDGSFTALRFTRPAGNTTVVYYVPLAGSVDVTKIQSYLGEVAHAGSAAGMSYADFGLDDGLVLRKGGGGADFMDATILHDHYVGLGGSDSLVGGMGADLLDGGRGNDVAQGGMQDDTLLGGAGNDLLQGGNDADRVQGDAGNDKLIGNWGDDRLFGGSGDDALHGGSNNDLLFGGAGNDTLNGFDEDDRLDDGSGSDLLMGGHGADTFVLATDGASDRIVDFENGVDRIDLNAAFASLIITTLSAGHVQVVHSGEVLLVEDAAHLLTAGDLTAADFQ